MEIIHQRKYDSRDVISYSNLMGLELELLERDNEFDSTKRMGLKECCDVTVDVESRGHIWAAPKAAFSSKLGPSNRSKNTVLIQQVYNRQCKLAIMIHQSLVMTNLEGSFMLHDSCIISSGSRDSHFPCKDKNRSLNGSMNYQFTLNSFVGRTFTWFRDVLI